MKVKALFPILDWLPNYNKNHLKGDVSAGITVGIMLIPQGMAYAMLAGLPPIYGLYAALVPQVVYAIMGTSRQLGVGPVAMDSLLVAVTVGQLAQTGTADYISLAIVLAFLVGMLQLLFGLLRLGFLVNFLSLPVISGFTSAAALIIGFSQLKYLMGVELGRSQYLHEILWQAVQHLSDVNVYALSLGIGGIGIILLVKKYLPKVPAPLVVVLGGVFLVWGLGLEELNVAIVKDVPSGLPQFSMPNVNLEWMIQLFSGALTIALVAFMEAIAVAKAIHAQHNDYKIRPNQELIALGTANVLGSFFQSFPGTGGFSRSAVNDQAGAKTNLAALISAGFVGLTLLFLTPLFYYLPKAVLASIIMVAVFKLISIQTPIDLYKNGQKRDLLILVATFLTTLSSGIQLGILLGVVLSIMGLIYDVWGANKASLTWNCIKKVLFPVELRVIEGRATDIVVQQDAPLYFVNSAFFKEEMEKIVTQYQGKTIVWEGVIPAKMDSTATHTIDLIRQLCIDKRVTLKIIP